MTDTKITNTPEEVRRRLDARLADLVRKSDRLNLPPEAGGMDRPERAELQNQLEAPTEDAARRALRFEIQRVRSHMELLDERAPRPNTAPDAARIAEQARSEIKALRPLRARLAREVLIEQRPGRMGLLEETEDRINRLTVEVERAELIVNEYPNAS
jgi:hypothetical protein